MKRSNSNVPENIPIRIVYQVYFFGVGLTLLVLACIALYAVGDALDDYNYIITNWKQKPIVDIRLTYSDCQQQEEILNHYYWPGTKPGCDCRNIRRLLRYTSSSNFIPKSKIYDDHACNSTQEEYGCITIPTFQEKDFNKFPDVTGVQGFTLCAQRDQDYSFYQNYSQTNNCPEGQLKCGTDQDRFICTKQLKCPISQLSVKSFKDMAHTEEQLLNSDVLQIDRQQGNQSPSVEMRVAEGGGVCLKNNQLSITSGRTDYILMNNKKIDCGRDQRFQQIASTSEDLFYYANNQFEITKSLRGYEINSNYKWGIYQRQYILWKMECRQYLKQFQDSKSQFDDIQTQQINLLIISIIFFVIISIGLSFVSGLNMAGYDWPCIKGKGTEESNYIFYMEIAFKIVLQLADAIIIIISFNVVRDIIIFLDSLVSKQCSDEITLNTIKHLSDTINETVYGYNLGQIILFFCTTFLDFIIATYLGIKYLISKKRLNQINNIKNLDPGYQGEPIEKEQHFPGAQQQEYNNPDQPYNPIQQYNIPQQAQNPAYQQYNQNQDYYQNPVVDRGPIIQPSANQFQQVNNQSTPFG